jgi:hypothetical protein
MNRKNSFLGVQVRSVDEQNLIVEHVVNTKGLDRYYTVVLPKGARVENYLKNPVVLWCHNVDGTAIKVPIGKCIELVVTEDAISVKTQFNANDPLAVKVFNAYKDGFLNAWSIGFQPEKWEEVTLKNIEEINARYNLALTTEDIGLAGFYGLYVIYQWELLEYSAVPVPGNPEALNKAYTAELVTRGLLEQEAIDNMLKKSCDSASATDLAFLESMLRDLIIAIETKLDKKITELSSYVYTSLAEDVKTISGKLDTLTLSLESIEKRIVSVEDKSEIKNILATVEELKAKLSVDNIENIRQIKKDSVVKGDTTGVFSGILNKK